MFQLTFVSKEKLITMSRSAGKSAFLRSLERFFIFIMFR